MQAIGILCAYLILAAIYTHPVLPRSHTGIANDPYDPILNPSILWWNATTIPFSPRWWSPPYFYPSQGVSAFTENLVGISVFAGVLADPQPPRRVQHRVLPDVAALGVRGVPPPAVSGAATRRGVSGWPRVRIHAVPHRGAWPHSDVVGLLARFVRLRTLVEHRNLWRVAELRVHGPNSRQSLVASPVGQPKLKTPTDDSED